MTRLEEDRIGFRVLDTDESPIVPIVPAAVIFDLLVGDPTHRPTRDDGYAAAHAALTGEPDTRSGSVGAGCGATAGRLRGGFWPSIHAGRGVDHGRRHCRQPYGGRHEPRHR